jgi:hypothetical protein
MCHALFLGSNKPLPLLCVSDGVWLGVEELAARHQPIRAHFPAGWHVYYLASHEGCGCVLHSDPAFADADDTYDRESRGSLADYLRRALADPAVALALYDCWEGDEDAPVLVRTAATPDELAARPDPVPERTWVTVLRASLAPP